MRNRKTRKKIQAGRELGMTLMEVLITIAILGALALIVSPVAGKIIRRSQSLAAYSSIQQTLATARLQAVKRGVPVVVMFSKAAVSPTPADLPTHYRIRMLTFQDRVNKETPLTSTEQGQVGNFIQDTNEPTLGDIVLPSTVVIWKQGETEHAEGPGIGFDKYNGNVALTDRVGFLPTGGIAAPEDTTTSGLPTPTGGRGIYFADPAGKNYFRVTIDSDISGRLVVDKYQDPTGYRAAGWTWY